MRKKLVSLLLTSLMLINYVHAKNVIYIGVEDDCPYSCRAENENGLKGFVQDILISIFENNDVEVRFRVFPWARALSTFNDISDSDLIAVVGMKIHAYHKELAFFPNTEIAQYTHAFYALNSFALGGNWKYNGVETLKGIRVGAVLGWAYCDTALTKYIQKNNNRWVSAISGGSVSQRNYQRLLLGRTDIWVANQYNANYLLLKKNRNADSNAARIVRVAKVPVTSIVDVYPVFYNNEKGKEYAQEFDDGMANLRESGLLDAILKTYNLKDWR
ncbi:MAG: ABC transporter substrate-binding protein [Bermanella sp.]